MSWVGPALGIVSTIAGINAQKEQAAAAKKQFKLSQSDRAESRSWLNDLRPAQQEGLTLAPGIAQLGRRALSFANSYDPETELTAARREYDRSLTADVSGARLPVGLRGLTNSSEDSTQTGAVLRRRAFDLGGFRLGQPQRTLGTYQAALGVGSPAYQTLNPAAISQGAAGILGGSAQTSANLGQQFYSNASQMNPYAALQGIDWKKFTMK